MSQHQHPIFERISCILQRLCCEPNTRIQRCLPSRTRRRRTIRESAAYLAKSPYIRNLAMLVICYGMSINIVEVTWKAKLKQQFPNPNDYSAFMGQFSSCTGAFTLFMMLLGQVGYNP